MIAGILLMSYISQQKIAGKSPSQNISLTIHLQSPTTWQLVWNKLGLCKKKKEKWFLLQCMPFRRQFCSGFWLPNATSKPWVFPKWWADSNTSSFGAVTILSWHYSCVTMVLLARLATRLDAMIAGGYATQHYSILVLVLVLVLALVLVLVLALPRCRADCSDCWHFCWLLTLDWMLTSGWMQCFGCDG